jgi:hypothetical protein
MDRETINVLETVCVAGGARAGFNDDANARLELLVEAGLLAVADPPHTETGTPARRRRFYKPTSKGVTMCQAYKTHGAA